MTMDLPGSYLYCRKTLVLKLEILYLLNWEVALCIPLRPGAENGMDGRKRIIGNAEQIYAVVVGAFNFTADTTRERIVQMSKFQNYMKQFDIASNVTEDEVEKAEELLQLYSPLLRPVPSGALMRWKTSCG